MPDRNDATKSHAPEPARATDWVRLAVPVLLVAAFIVLAWKLGYFDLKHPEKLNRAAQKAQDHSWFAVVFVLAYAAIASLAAPVSPLAYAAGAMFGTLEGSICVWIGSMLGGVAGYWLARGVWADSARRLLGRYHEKLNSIRNSNAFLTSLRLQLMPIVPFGVFNYSAGTMKLGFVGFILGTAIGVTPGSIAAVYVGDRIAAGIRGDGKSAFIIAGAVMLALLALSFLPTLVGKFRSRR